MGSPGPIDLVVLRMVVVALATSCVPVVGADHPEQEEQVVDPPAERVRSNGLRVTP